MRALPCCDQSKTVNVLQLISQLCLPLQVDAEDDSQWTPLIIASSARHVDCVSELLDFRASAETSTAYQQTALHYAASRNRIQNISLLLKVGSSVTQQDKYGSTPLHRATSRGNLEVTRLLLEAKANPNAQDGKGNTPLHLAVEGSHRKVFDELNKECRRRPRYCE